MSVPFEEFWHHYQVIIIYNLVSLGKISVSNPSQLSPHLFAFVLFDSWPIFEREKCAEGNKWVWLFHNEILEVVIEPSRKCFTKLEIGALARFRKRQTTL